MYCNSGLSHFSQHRITGDGEDHVTHIAGLKVAWANKNREVNLRLVLTARHRYSQLRTEMWADVTADYESLLCGDQVRVFTFTLCKQLVDKFPAIYLSSVQVQQDMRRFTGQLPMSSSISRSACYSASGSMKAESLSGLKKD